jgi:hypothetical protein
MLMELDSDQRLLQETVRDVVAKECPASLIRGVVDNGADPAPVWKVYVDLGWTELTEPSDAVRWRLCWRSWAAPPIRHRFWRR